MQASALPREIKKFQVRKGDVLATKDSEEPNDIAVSALISEDLPNVLCGYHLALIRPKVNRMLGEYLAWVQSSKGMLQQYEARAVGVTRFALSQSAFKEIVVPVPPPDEQRRIAVYLDEVAAKIDYLMGLRRQQIELLKEQRAALIQQAVTRGLKRHAALRESGLPWLGQIARHWELKPVKYAARIRRGKFGHRPRNDPAYYGGQYPFVQTGDVATAKKYITTHTQTLNEKGYGVSAQFPAGTLLMAIAANIGDLAILGFNACVPDSIVGLFPYKGVEVEFLYYQLSCLQSWLHALAPENTQMNLNVDRFSPQKIAVPPHDEQKEICQFIIEMEAQVEATLSTYNRQLELLSEYRATLIYEYVTGQRSVT
jgi:type I restriction enzyme S subunit